MNELNTLKAQIADPKEERITLNQLLNFSLDNKKVVYYQLKSPFNEIIKSRKAPSSRG